ncbi:hypothetical protein EIP86_005143 [Pleurotus ostreatoroseus]|nr:hypothetical protein EIP86_005143 [Pleurotus ostreatoroseus]
MGMDTRQIEVEIIKWGKEGRMRNEERERKQRAHSYSTTDSDMARGFADQDSLGDETAEPDGTDHSLTEFRLVLGAGVFVPVPIPVPTATPTPDPATDPVPVTVPASPAVCSVVVLGARLCTSPPILLE